MHGDHNQRRLPTTAPIYTALILWVIFTAACVSGAIATVHNTTDEPAPSQGNTATQ